MDVELVPDMDPDGLLSEVVNLKLEGREEHLKVWWRVRNFAPSDAEPTDKDDYCVDMNWINASRQGF